MPRRIARTSRWPTTGPASTRRLALGPVDGHIGLALLTDAAEGVGGRLDLRSRPGNGTTVRLTVPVPHANGAKNGATAIIPTPLPE